MSDVVTSIIAPAMAAGFGAAAFAWCIGFGWRLCKGAMDVATLD